MDVYIGTILLWAPNFAPQGFSYCNGAIMAISQNQALFALLGTTYGGNGSTTFGLPDLRSRAPMGAGMGQGPGLTTYPLGTMGGVEGVTLQTAQMPAHNHPAAGEIVVRNTPATSNQPQAGQVIGAVRFQSGPNVTNVNAYAAADGDAVTLAPGTVSIQVGPAGNGLPHENRMPFTGVSFIIAVTGLFPPRP